MQQIVAVHRGYWINLQNSGATRRHNVPARQGNKSFHSKLSRLLSGKHSRKPVEHCEQSPRGGGVQGTSDINGRRFSNFIKKADVVLSVQSSPPESNTVWFDVMRKSWRNFCHISVPLEMCNPGSDV